MNETLAFIHSPVGILKLTQTGDVITAIHFQDEGIEEISGIFPTDLLAQCTLELSEYFEGKRTSFSFPFKQDGTPFQQRVWQELQTIPFGKTVSYNTMAINLGDVKCIRAAATANGKNNIAIVVPCHRVIGTNGSLTGYAGGLWRKQWLLEHEAKFAHGVQMLF